MTVKAIKSKAEFDELINSGKVIFIDFWATWCGPCRAISPVFAKHASDLTREGAVEFYKVDVDELPEVSEAAGIRAMPTFKVYKGGVLLNELVGANPPQLQVLINAGVSA